MKRPFEIRLQPDPAYQRHGVFALELLDPVTMARVSRGITVKADGLREPFVNAGGLFVWVDEDASRVQAVSIDPGVLPYREDRLGRDRLRLPPVQPAITTVELAPRPDYQFTAGITGLRATLLDTRAPARPARDVEIRLRWLDEDGATWRDATTAVRTDARGDFVALLRFAPQDAPRLDADGFTTVRLKATRDGAVRESASLKLLQGRVTNPTTSNPLTFAWDELQP